MDQEQFGPYQFRQLLGRGGMGEVYRAYDTSTDRIVAIKILSRDYAEDEHYQQRFLREARAAASLNEPHVIPIHRFGEIDGRLYVDMRLIEGRDLQAVLSDGPINPARAVGIIEQIADALGAAHEIGLVHRDVKPSNILVTPRDFAYLIDFGIARAANQTSMTMAGQAVGTLAYMAPERFQSGGGGDLRADVYALACVLCQSLIGRPPFEGASMEKVITGHLVEPPPRPSEAGLPRAFDDVIATGLAKNPADRYPTAEGFAQAARRALTAPSPAGASTDVIAQRRPVRPTAMPPRGRPPTVVPPPYSTSAPPTPIPPTRIPQQPNMFHGTPVSMPPPSGPIPAQPHPPNVPWWKQRLVALTAIIAAVVTAATITGLVIANGRSDPAEPQGGSVTPTDLPDPQRTIDELLLSPRDAGAAMGLKDVAMNSRLDRLVNTVAVTPQQCEDVIAPDPTSYGSTGFTETRLVGAVAPGDDASPSVTQAIYRYASDERAHASIEQSAAKWQACLNQDITVTSPMSEPSVLTASDYVAGKDTISAVVRAKDAPPDFSCQHAASAIKNFVVDVYACNFNVRFQASDIVDRIGRRIE